MISMNNTPRGLPLTSSHVEQIFPKLTPAQIRRIAAHGHMRAMQRGEVLYEQGDTAVPFFVVVSGELEILRPMGPGAVETLVIVYESGQFTGEVGTLSGRRTLFRVRVTKPGKVIELDRQYMRALVQSDAELSQILMRALEPLTFDSCFYYSGIWAGIYYLLPEKNTHESI
jgi:thioredoxin reductase (NADPH)